MCAAKGALQHLAARGWVEDRTKYNGASGVKTAANEHAKSFAPIGGVKPICSSERTLLIFALTVCVMLCSEIRDKFFI